MFNLFPKKKSVDKIIEDADLTPPWEWTPTQTPSMLQAQNELIEQFLKEINSLRPLKEENEKLKALQKGYIHERDAAREINSKQLLEIEKWEKDWDEQNKNIIELTKEVNSLRHLKQENADLMEMLAKYRGGYQGSCYACEPVGELNQKQEQQIIALHKIIEGAKNTIDELKAQKHPMYPLHWMGLDPLIHEQSKDLTIEETIDKVKQKTTWVEEPVDWNGETQYDIVNGLKVQKIPYVGCACGSCEDSKPKEKSWEEAAGDLALRVAKLEKQLKHTPKIVFNEDSNYEYFKKHGKWPYDVEDNNPLYKGY